MLTRRHVRQVAGVATQSLAHSSSARLLAHSSSSSSNGDKPIGNNDLASIKEAIQAKEAEINKGRKEDAMQEQQGQQAQQASIHLHKYTHTHTHTRTQICFRK
jgi:hypothetical protein